MKENDMVTTLATSFDSLTTRFSPLPLLAQTSGIPSLVWLAIVFFIIAIVAYVVGAKGVAGMSAGIGRTLLIVFLVLAVLFAIIGMINRA
jgi:uncharacterized membrane protein YtjA (UPF0391 family)